MEASSTSWSIIYSWLLCVLVFVWITSQRDWVMGGRRWERRIVCSRRLPHVSRSSEMRALRSSLSSFCASYLRNNPSSCSKAASCGKGGGGTGQKGGGNENRYKKERKGITISIAQPRNYSRAIARQYDSSSATMAYLATAACNATKSIQKPINKNKTRTTAHAPTLLRFHLLFPVPSFLLWRFLFSFFSLPTLSVGCSLLLFFVPNSPCEAGFSCRFPLFHSPHAACGTLRSAARAHAVCTSALTAAGPAPSQAERDVLSAAGAVLPCGAASP